MPCAGALEELPDRRVRPQRRQQLDARARAADVQHRLAHPLLLVDLLVHDVHVEGAGVEGDRLVEVAHGQTDVVDAGQHAAIVTALVR